MATCLIAAACVAGPGASPSLGPDRVSLLATDEAIANTGITLSPPGPASATVDAQAAFALCSSGVASCPDTSPTAAQLTLATDTGPAQLDSSGKVNLLMDRRLAWALTCRDVECHSSGGPYIEPSAKAQQPTGSTQLSCGVIAFVDARSGAYLSTVTHELP